MDYSGTFRNIEQTSVRNGSCDLWYYDDIPQCARNRIEGTYPAVLGILSLAILFVKSGQSLIKPRHSDHDNAKEREPLLAQTDAYGSVEGDSSDNNVSMKQRHFDISRLPDTDVNGLPHGQLKYVTKSVSERFRVSLEYILVILEVGISAWLILDRDLKFEFSQTTVPLAKFFLWVYLFVVVSIRIINMNKVNIRLPSLWNHCTIVYFFNSLFTIVFFRSVLIGHVSTRKVGSYYILDFVFSISLLILNITSSSGDKPAEVYVPTDGTHPSPESVTSILSFVTYSWLDPMVFKSYKKPLAQGDIWGLIKEDYALYVLRSFEKYKKAASFSYNIAYHFKSLFFIQCFWASLEAFFAFAPSVLLKKVLEYVDDPTAYSKNIAWTFVCLMPIAKFADSVSAGVSLFLGRRICARIRAIIIGEVYAKALRRKITVTKKKAKSDEKDKGDDSDSNKDKSKKDEDDEESAETAELGAIINLMSVDAFKVSEICAYLHYLINSIFMVIICISLLYSILGWCALVGSFSIIVLLPLNYKLSSWMSLYQKKMLTITDKRIQKINETLQSIRIIKFFAWEEKFMDSILKVRAEEIGFMLREFAVWSCAASLWFITPTLITLFSFYSYTIIEGKPLTAPVAFTSLSLFALLRSPLDYLVDIMSRVIQSKVSLDRIDDFLNEEETTKYDQLNSQTDSSSSLIGFENATFSWNAKSESEFKLRDLNIEFKLGKLNVIIGPTGSGKTSILLALLGEMDLLAGKVFLPGAVPRDDLIVDPRTGFTESVAYCAQNAWLLNDTIKNNIIFDSPFNKPRYDKVIEACGLVRDFQILSAGDATEIGEKGITLSGGQKQRVSLARALYSNSRHVILDDCLSAVDSHTALWIYDNCVCGPLMEGRTCILVSHNVALTVQKADWIIAVNNGRVKDQGTPEQLLESGELGDDDMIKYSVLNTRNQSSSNLAKDNKSQSKADLQAKAALIDAKLKALSNEDVEETTKTDGKLIEDESKAEGVVSSEVYKRYAVQFGGVTMWTFIVLGFVLSQSIYVFQSWWIRSWSANSSLTEKMTTTLGQVYDGTFYDDIPVVNFVLGTANPINNLFSTYNTESKKDSMYYIEIYAVIGFVYASIASARVFFTFYAGTKASNRIFKEVLNNVMRAKLRFFDKTPIGRIMNRFSKDIESVDQELTPMAEGVFACVIQCVSTLTLITFITPGFLVFAVLISFLYWVVGKLYLTLSRELKRYDSITKSPIHQHFSETLVGVSTIRAYGVEARFMKQNLNAVDQNNRPFFYLWVANRWLSFRVDAVGSLVSFIAGIFVLLSVGKIDAGLAGISMTYAIAFSESALWIVRLYSNMEMNMNSVERLQEYTDIDQEPPYHIPETEPAASWPEQGKISVQNLSLRYSPELPKVINDVSFDVDENQKVGIVGRTGAGKSTIITAFFRFMDPESGSILIDGVDITKIGLHRLRNAITIIPQDPTLFAGTIRSNLDPFTQYTDAQIGEALKRVNLITDDRIDDGENQNKFLDLDNPIAEGGGNLSQGERQLVCMARSLLKNPKIIFLDEATSSIDYHSDAMIQKTIREGFSNSTILTIAHRLRTIIDYDKILVMDAGKVVEYDSPYALISNKESVFYSMCENSGELDSLVNLAKDAYVKLKNQS